MLTVVAAIGRFIGRQNKTRPSEVVCNNWMATVPDNVHLSELVLVGTHNSAASKSYLNSLLSAFAECQLFSVKSQLAMGVSVLDLRLRFIDDYIGIHHDKVYYNVGFRTLFIQIVEFLKERPGQFVVLILKREHTIENTANPASVFAELIESVARDHGMQPSTLLVPDDVELNAGNLRGRVLLLTRSPREIYFADYTRHISGWEDNRISTTPDFIIQDMYAPASAEAKWDAVTQAAQLVAVDDSKKVLLNFVSRQFSVGDLSVEAVAHFMNKEAVDKIAAVKKGIYLVDYVYPELVMIALARNFPYTVSTEMRARDIFHYYK
jgi:1-phosphatidylinositol phosphodiesterase